MKDDNQPKVNDLPEQLDPKLTILNPNPVVTPKEIGENTCENEQLEEKQEEQAEKPLNNNKEKNDSISTLNNDGPLPDIRPNDIEFVAASVTKKKKSPIPIVLLIAVCLGLVGYFLVYPYLIGRKLSKPINVYTTTINKVANNSNTVINEIVNDKIYYEYLLNLETNIDDFKSLNDYTYRINYGYDLKNKTYETQFHMSNKNGKEYGGGIYFKDNKFYGKLSTYHELLYLNENKNEYLKNLRSFINSFSNKASSKEINYLINKISKIINNSFDESKFGKNKTEINLNNKKYKVTENNYTLDYDSYSKLITSLKNELLNDDKATKILEKLLELSSEELSLNFDDYLNSLDKEFKLIFTIYTYGLKNEISGIKINDGNDIFYYINLKDDFEINYSNINIVGIRNGNKTDVVFKEDKNSLLELSISKFKRDNVDLSYIYNMGDDKYTGQFKYKQGSSKDNLSFNVNAGKEYINLKSDIIHDNNVTVSDINTASAKTLNDENFTQVMNDFATSLSETPLAFLIVSVSGDITTTQFSIKDERCNYAKCVDGKCVYTDSDNKEIELKC